LPRRNSFVVPNYAGFSFTLSSISSGSGTSDETITVTGNGIAGTLYQTCVGIENFNNGHWSQRPQTEIILGLAVLPIFPFAVVAAAP
jgi:hypothetical protein